jgi:hypothetical protein
VVVPVSIGAEPEVSVGALDGAHPPAQVANVQTKTMQ